MAKRGGEGANGDTGKDDENGKDGPSTVERRASDSFDDILKGATPPDIWSDEFIETLSPGRRGKDCGVVLTLPAATFTTRPLGQVQGLEDAETAIRNLDNLVFDVVNIVREQLPRFLDSALDAILGPSAPPPPSPFPSWPLPGLPLPIPGPNPFLFLRIQTHIGLVLAKVALIRTSFGTQPTPTMPTFAAAPDTIGIRVGHDMQAAVRIYSKMESTYTFGRGRGTSHGPANPTIAPAIAAGFDRPWFGKGAIPQSIMPNQDSIPYPMPSSGGAWVAQLGVAGEEAALHSGLCQLTVAQGLDVKIRFNGNYGRCRVIVIPPPPCEVVFGDFEIIGPYEDDIAAQEDVRFRDIERRRDDMLASMSKLQNTLGVLGSAAGVIPVVGAAVDTLLAAIGFALEDVKTSVAKGIDTANATQHRANLTFAEYYPERAPIGGTEDQDLP